MLPEFIWLNTVLRLCCVFHTCKKRIHEQRMPSSRKRLGDPKRRKRTIITPDQLLGLERTFLETPWPNRTIKEQIAKDLGFGVKFIRTWFQNRRAKARREEILPKNPWVRVKSESDLGTGKDKRIRSSSSESTDTSMNMSSVDLDVGSEIMNSDGESSTQQEVTIDVCSTPPDQDRELQREVLPQDGSLSNVKIDLKQEIAVEKSAGSDRSDDSISKKPKYRKILPLEKAPMETSSDNSLQDLINLTKNINNQMNWGTFGLTNITSAPGFARELQMTSEEKPDKPITVQQVTVQSSQTSITAKKLSKSGEKRRSSPKAQSGTAVQESKSEPTIVLPQIIHPVHPPELFKAVINMIALAEGGIIPVGHPDFSKATNDFLYGVRVNGSRLVYSKAKGLDIIDDVSNGSEKQ